MYGNLILPAKASHPTLLPALEKYHCEGITNDKKISEQLQKEYKLEIGYVLLTSPYKNSSEISIAESTV